MTSPGIYDSTMAPTHPSTHPPSSFVLAALPTIFHIIQMRETGQKGGTHKKLGRGNRKFAANHFGTKRMLLCAKYFFFLLRTPGRMLSKNEETVFFFLLLLLCFLLLVSDEHLLPFRPLFGPLGPRFCGLWEEFFLPLISSSRSGSTSTILRSSVRLSGESK